MKTIITNAGGWMALALLSSGSMHAALLPRLGGSAVYDTDLNVTWLTNANLAATKTFGVAPIAADGSMNWNTAQNWIAALNGANYLGFSTWRLPTTLQPDPSCSMQDTFNHISYNFSCSGSELGHLFYVDLGGSAGVPISTTHNANYNLFSNIQAAFYWSSTPYSLDSTSAWADQFQNGSQVAIAKANSVFVMAVMTGDVVASVSKILPQFAFGGGWYSALYFTNTSSVPISFLVSFSGDDGTPLNVPSIGTSATVSLMPGGTAIVEAPNTGSLSEGYVSASLPAGVSGYGIFRQTVPGRPDQEAVVPLSGTSTTTSTLIWDDSNFITTSIAVVNLGAVRSTLTVTVRDPLGNILGTSQVAILAKSKLTVELRTLPGLAAMAGNRGSADFTLSSGNLAVLGLRFGNSAFTSIPTSDR